MVGLSIRGDYVPPCIQSGIEKSAKMAWPNYYGTPSFRAYIASDIFSSLKTQIFTQFRTENAQANLEAL